MNQHPNRTPVKWLLFLFVIFFSLIMVYSLVEYRTRFHDLLQLYQDQASMTAAVMAQGSVNQALLNQELKQNYVDRAMDLLDLLNRFDQEGTLGEEQLHRLVPEHGPFQLSTFDAQGNLIAPKSNTISKQVPASVEQTQILRQNIQALLSNTSTWLVEDQLGDTSAVNIPLLVGRTRSSGGAWVVTLDPDEQEAYRYLTTLELGLNDLINVQGMEYFLLDLNDGLPYEISKSSLPLDSSWTRQSLEDILYQVSKGDTTWLEVVRPVFFQDGIGEVRIGFESTALFNLRNQIIYQIVLRTLLLVGLAFVSFWYFITRQNAALLEKEKVRIEAEVVRLEKLNYLHEKQAAMGELAAGVAHEIRNPLNAIGIAAQRLKREFKPDLEGDEYAALTSSMVSEIQRINQSLQEFLDYTKPTALNLAPIQSGKLLAEVLKLHESQAIAKGVNLECQSSAVTFQADPVYLKQALSNLVNNAVDACSAEDNIVVTCELEESRVKIGVRDGGAGILGEHLDRIFDIYFSTKDMGAGVGLALTHKIIADHRGFIEVQSIPGQGSYFEINLPVGS